MENTSYYIFGSLIGSFLLAFFIFPSFIKLLERNNLVDVPDHRKVHKRSVPGMGGVVVFVAMMLTLIFFVSVVDLAEKRLFLGALLLIFIVGLRDDITPLRPSLKLLSQLVPTVLVFWLDDVRIESLYSIADVHFPFIISAFITCFTIIIITNSFNLIDGIDGLAGSVSLASLTAFASYFFFSGQLYLSFILFALMGTLLAFLFYNWSPAKVFLGDNGALLVGFTLSCVSIVFINHNYDSSEPLFAASVGTAMCFIAVPLYDMFRIIGLRLFKKRGLMTADRNHLHHMLLDLGLSHPNVTLVLLSIQVGLILLAYFFREMGEAFIFGTLAVVMFGTNGIILFLTRRKAKAKESRVQ